MAGVEFHYSILNEEVLHISYISPSKQILHKSYKRLFKGTHWFDNKKEEKQQAFKPFVLKFAIFSKNPLLLPESHIAGSGRVWQGLLFNDS